jgi:hypothetical protein
MVVVNACPMSSWTVGQIFGGINASNNAVCRGRLYPLSYCGCSWERCLPPSAHPVLIPGLLFVGLLWLMNGLFSFVLKGEWEHLN